MAAFNVVRVEDRHCCQSFLNAGMGINGILKISIKPDSHRDTEGMKGDGQCVDDQIELEAIFPGPQTRINRIGGQRIAKGEGIRTLL